MKCAMVDCAINQTSQGLPQVSSNVEILCSPKCGFVDASLDLLDLPEPDEEKWEFDQVEAESDVDWDLGEEEGKACSDRVAGACKTTHRFNKVYEVNTSNGKTLIPKQYKAVHGSPSARVKKSPFTLSEAIRSTRRIRITFEDVKNKSQKRVFGTAFKVSQRMVCSARHCFQKDEMSLVCFEMCEGSNVSSRRFDSESCACKLEKISAHHWSQTKDGEGLFQHGADVAVFQSEDESTSFFLPCSPSFLSTRQAKNVAILSYPSVHNMLQKAKQDLSKSGMTSTWKTYAPAMAKDIANATQKLATSERISLENVSTKQQLPKSVLDQIKKTLFDDLEETFGGFSSGSLLCSVGSLVGWNGVSIDNTCSTLRGSAGAAIYVVDLPGYFIGIHSGGICGYDMNGATSTDNEEFVEMYMTCVLPTLPSLSFEHWNSIDTKGFTHWLELHTDHIPQGSPWHGRALGRRTRGCCQSEGCPAKRR